MLSNVYQLVSNEINYIYRLLSNYKVTNCKWI